MKKATNTQQLAKAKTTAESNGKMTASQKLELLETVAQNQSRQIEIMAEEIDRLSNVMTALAKRINAVVRSGDEGQQISSKQVNTLLISDAAKELEGKVNFLIEQGVLVLDNSREISTESFVVGREINTENEEVNPRVQFAVKSLELDGQEKVLGKKTGELIVGDDGINMEILQVFTIVEPATEK
jgi:hypothetical protein